MLFYFRYQRGERAAARVVLAASAPVVLSLLLLALAEPILTIKIASRNAAGLVAAV